MVDLAHDDADLMSEGTALMWEVAERVREGLNNARMSRHSGA